MASTRSRASARLGAALACLALVTACSGTSTGGAGTTSAPPSGGGSSSTTVPNQHQTSPAGGESSALAATLVTVPGYGYVDVGARELAVQSAAAKKLGATAYSFHGVTRPPGGEEIAFLSQFVLSPTDAAWAPDNAETFAQQVLGTTAVTSTTVSGQQVWAAENPAAPKSRYTYTWTRHGTVSWLDGPDKAATQGFLAAYFAVPFRGAEDPALAARTVDVPGYAWTDATDRPTTDVLASFPGGTASLHYVFDRVHMFGGLLLARPASPVGDADVLRTTVAALSRTSGVDPPDVSAEAAPRTLSGVTVHSFTDTRHGVTYYAWRWPSTGVIGCLATSRPDLAEIFLPAYLAAAGA